MEVDNNEQEHPDAYASWWGGAENLWVEDSWGCAEDEDWREESDPEISQMNSQWGKGPKEKGKGPGFGKSSWGDKGGKKGWQKGKGKGKGNAPFQGECQWCGKWGHSASRCHQKDEYMSNLRQT